MSAVVDAIPAGNYIEVEWTYSGEAATYRHVVLRARADAYCRTRAIVGSVTLRTERKRAWSVFRPRETDDWVALRRARNALIRARRARRKLEQSFHHASLMFLLYESSGLMGSRPRSATPEASAWYAANDHELAARVRVEEIASRLRLGEADRMVLR